MTRNLGCGLAVMAAVLATAAPRAQSDAPQVMSDEAFGTLKKLVLETGNKISIPPDIRAVFRMQETASRVEARQLVAVPPGSDTKYSFIVRTEGGDDVWLSVQNEEGTRMYMTNSKLTLRGAVSLVRGQPPHALTIIAPIPADFTEVLRLWASVAASQ